MELRTEDDIGPYKRHELLTGKIYYPALGYSGYGDGKSTHIADFVLGGKADITQTRLNVRF